MGTDTTVNKLQVMALSPRHEKKKQVHSHPRNIRSTKVTPCGVHNAELFPSSLLEETFLGVSGCSNTEY